MNLGRMCMKLFLRGRPYTDYEDDVILHYMNGAAVGELNHSRKLSAAVLIYSNNSKGKKVRMHTSPTNWPPTCSKHHSRQSDI